MELSDFRLTNEASELIKAVLEDEKINGNITACTFLITLFEQRSRSCLASRVLTKLLLSEDITSIVLRCSELNTELLATPSKYGNSDAILYPILKSVSNEKKGNITSCDILLRLLKSYNEIYSIFLKYGVTSEQINEEYANLIPSEKNEGAKKTQKSTKETTKHPSKNAKRQESVAGETEKNLTNLSTEAENGNIQAVYGNDDVISRIFTTLCKRENNNVVLVGETGVGKSATVRHIANILCSESCPKMFVGKQLMYMDFRKLITGTMYKGLFEMKMQSIVNDASKKGNYILFADDIEYILSGNVKLGEIPNSMILDAILSNTNIKFICTTTPEGFSHCIESDPILSNRFVKIDLIEPNEENAITAVTYKILDLETFHNVKYTNKSISEAVTLAKKHISSDRLPSSAINILDECAASKTANIKRSENTLSIISEIDEILEEIDKINATSDSVEYDRIDELTRQELKLRSKLSITERDEANNEKAVIITPEDIRRTVSEMTGMPLEKLTDDEKKSLVNFDKKIKECVIGQDEAVETVCKAIKRKRVGISNEEKPNVFLFVGKSGTGKTFLAKTIAKEVFGNENNMVRVDMSEYSDKMSVNKLVGAGAGYIGYEDGGILTEAVKRNKRCVLLLDEIEKANDEVFNVLLQVFDEGRLTDNHGVLVDFKDAIIIMTSNIGAAEVTENGGYIGFTSENARSTAETERAKSIINNAIKRKFKPEFINRIDKIVWFNPLGEEELIKIATNEIKKVDERLLKIGYSLSDEIKETKIPKEIVESIKKEKDYGARPILRMIETLVEDRITDIILENEPEKGHIFSYEEVKQTNI